MSIGGEMWEEAVWENRKKLKEFIAKLKERLDESDEQYFTVWNIIEDFKQHFKIDEEE